MYLKEGALFIADAHYHPKVREELYDTLVNFKAPQLFLVGDIFDLLVGEVAATIEENQKLIALLNEIGQQSECYYFEGNHDFLLQNIFPSWKVFDRFHQPALFQAGDKRIAISHGDVFIDGFYRYYIETLHKKGIIHSLDILNIGGWLSALIQRYNKNKRLCKKIERFEEIAKKRASYYDADIIIEGHFHQKRSFTFDSKRYINVPAFACTHQALIYNDGAFSAVRI